MELFKDTKEFGSLFYGVIYLSYDIPQLFTVENNAGQALLMLATDDNEWLGIKLKHNQLAEIEGKRLLDVIMATDCDSLFIMRDTNVSYVSPKEVTDDYLPNTRFVFLSGGGLCSGKIRIN